jgi:hypothetical protein
VISTSKPVTLPSAEFWLLVNKGRRGYFLTRENEEELENEVKVITGKRMG